MTKYLKSEYIKHFYNKKLWVFLAFLIVLGWFLQYKFFSKALDYYPFWKTSYPDKTIDYYIFTQSNFQIFLFLFLGSILLTVLLLEPDVKAKLGFSIKILPINALKFITTKLLFFLGFMLFTLLFMVYFYRQNLLDFRADYTQSHDFSYSIISFFFIAKLLPIACVFLLNFIVFCVLDFKIVLASLLCLVINFLSILIPYSPLYIIKKHVLFTDDFNFEYASLASLGWFILYMALAIFCIKKHQLK